MSTAEQNDQPPPQPAPKPKATKGAAAVSGAKSASSSSSAAQESSPAPVFLVRADVKERKKPPPNLAVVGGSGKEDDSSPSVLEADGVIASLEASPSVGDVTSALDTCMEQALRLISVPGRIYSEPALDAYR